MSWCSFGLWVGGLWVGPYGRASNTRLNGVPVARRNRVKPAPVASSARVASGTWEPSAQPPGCDWAAGVQMDVDRSEDHTSELQSLMRRSYAGFCLKKKNENTTTRYPLK